MKTLKKFSYYIFTLLTLIFLEVVGLMLILVFEDMGILNPNWSAFMTFAIALAVFFTFVWLDERRPK